MSVCTLGDLLVDVIVAIDGPIAADTDTFGDIEVAAGGQAANVSAWVATLGGRAGVICARCSDPAGAMLETDMALREVELVGPRVEGRTGTVVSLARADGTRSMLTDRGSAAALDGAAIQPAWLEGFGSLHVSGYALAAEPMRSSAIRTASLAADRGMCVSVDLASTSAIDATGPAAFAAALAELKPALVFATEAEHEALSVAAPGGTSPETLVLKRGAAGFSVIDAAGSRHVDAAPVTVVDATGAGDALAAGYLVGGAELARDAAARCLAQRGAMP